MSFFLKRVSGDEGGFGQDLQDLRLVRGLTEEQLSKISGIHAAMIKVLEEERLHELQDPCYAERLVRSLAKALEVRPDFLITKYRKALELRGIEQSHSSSLRPTARKRDFFVISSVRIVAGILCVATAIGGYITWQARQISLAPTLEISSPEEGYKTLESKVEVSGKTEPTTFVSVNGQQAVVQPDGHFTLSLRVPSGLTTVHIEARRRYGDPTVVERRVLFERHEAAILE